MSPDATEAAMSLYGNAIRHAVRTGELPHEVVGGRIRIQVDDLDRWLVSNLDSGE